MKEKREIHSDIFTQDLSASRGKRELILQAEVVLCPVGDSDVNQIWYLIKALRENTREKLELGFWLQGFVFIVEP